MAGIEKGSCSPTDRLYHGVIKAQSIRCLMSLFELDEQKAFQREGCSIFGGLHAAAGICVHLGHYTCTHLCCWDVTPAYPVFFSNFQPTFMMLFNTWLNAFSLV